MTDLERIKKDVVEMDSRANVCWYDTKVLTKAVRLILEELTADRKTENSSEKPNNCECEPRKEQNFCGKCRYLYRDFKYGLSCYRLMDNEPCKYEERKDEPSISKMEQVDKTQTCSFSDCDNFKNPDYARCIECKRKQIKAKDEPQTDCAWK